MRTAHTFDDVLLVPKFSNVESRKQVDISSDLDNKYSLKIPIISSPMDTITSTDMACALSARGALGVVHRYNSILEQAKIVFSVYSRHEEAHPDVPGVFAAAVGMTGDFYERSCALVDAGANVLCVDVAHGHHSVMERCLKTLKDKFSDSIHIMAGNVATLEGFDALASWGADSVRIGIGGGSICSTRLVSGHGVPTLQSIIDCSKSEHDAKIIADGGIKTTGDIVKAFAAGADFVMIGSMLAGTDETPGEVFLGKESKKYKVYRGMASAAAQNSWRGKSSTPEGISTTVPYKGSVNAVLDDVVGGIRSGLSYSGCHTIDQLHSKAEFILQTSAGRGESATHILSRNK
tara:strand:- start:331 stop:1374 length:1044 start_codon:yes stop_codon:yes gene_type:complete